MSPITTTLNARGKTRMSTSLAGGTLLAAFSATNDGFTTKNGIRLFDGSFFDLSTAISYDGTHSYRARRAEDSRTELRFEGLPGLEEPYISFRMYQPSGTETPFIGNAIAVPGPVNDKFVRVFNENNATAGKFAAAMGASTRDGALFAEYNVQRSVVEPIAEDRFDLGRGTSYTIPPDTNDTYPIIGNTAFLGRWVKIGMRFKMATSTNDDGIFQLYIDDVLVMNRQRIANYLFPQFPDRLFHHGYILGAQDNLPATGAPGEYIYLDDVRFSTGGFA